VAPAWLAVPVGLGACTPLAASIVPQEDFELLQEVIRRQERRVAQARAELAQAERELRMVQMRRRMLEQAGRHDLAAALETEERGLEQRRATLQRALADEEDALAIYRRRGTRVNAQP
jgi:hypothetical protein